MRERGDIKKIHSSKKRLSGVCLVGLVIYLFEKGGLGGTWSETMNAGLEEIANRAVDRLAELAAGYIGEGRNCTDCGEWKVWNEFGEHKKCKNGKRPMCKNCHNAVQQQRNLGLKRLAPERPETLKCRGKCKRELIFDETNFKKKIFVTMGSRLYMQTLCSPDFSYRARTEEKTPKS